MEQSKYEYYDDIYLSTLKFQTSMSKISFTNLYFLCVNILTRLKRQTKLNLGGHKDVYK